MIEKVTARARRDGRWWVFEVPELTSTGPVGERVTATGQSRSLKDLERDVRDVAALVLDVEEYPGEVEVAVELPAEAMEMWAQANERDAHARAEARDAAILRRDAVRALTGSKEYRISQHDVAVALGVSPQRISQLAR